MMRDLIRLFTVSLEQKLAHELPDFMRRLAFRLVAALFLLSAFACLLVSFWIYLIPKVGPAGAPLVIAGVLAFIALTFFVLGQRRHRRIVVVETVTTEARMAADPSAIFRDHKGAILAALFTAAFERGARR